MKKYLLNLALLFIAMGAAAQINYQSGYVITNSNDTIRGLINYGKVQYTIQTLNFKKSATDNPTAYNPTSLKGFSVDNNKYISYAGRVSNNKNSPPDIDIIKDTTTTYTALFLQQLTSGPNAGLYINTDKLKTRFFLKEKSSIPVELLYYEYANDDQPPHKISAFMSPIIELFNKYNNYNETKLHALQNTPFTQAGLENAVSIINNNIINKNSKQGIRLFAGLGYAKVTTTIYTLSNEGNNTGVVSTNPSPRISMGIDLVSNPEAQKFVLRGELSVSKLKPSYRFTRISDDRKLVTTNNTFDYDEYTVSLAPQLLYHIYNSKNFKFFVSAGLSVNFSIYNNKVLFMLNKINNEYYNFYNPAVQMSFPLQAGIVVSKHIELEAIYTPNIYVSPVKKQSIGGGIHYLF